MNTAINVLINCSPSSRQYSIRQIGFGRRRNDYGYSLQLTQYVTPPSELLGYVRM